MESGNATILILKETRERVLINNLFQFGLIIGIETDFGRQFVGQMYYLHTRLPKTDDRRPDCRRFRLEGKKEPGGVEDQRIVLQLRVFDVTFFAVEDEKCILVSFGAVLISFFTFSMSYGKTSPAKWGSGFLFLHQRRRPRQTASKEAVEKNVGDLNETFKSLPRIVSL